MGECALLLEKCRAKSCRDVNFETRKRLYIVRYIQESAAIEGNRLTPEEATKIIVGGKNSNKNGSLAEQLQIRGLWEATQQVRHLNLETIDLKVKNIVVGIN